MEKGVDFLKSVPQQFLEIASLTHADDVKWKKLTREKCANFLLMLLDLKFVQNGVRTRSLDPFYWRQISDTGLRESVT